MSRLTIGDLKEGDYFRFTHRPEGRQVGVILRQGTGSTTVKIMRQDRPEWETTPLARGAECVPATSEEFHTQSSGRTDGRQRDRSKIEKPVDVVWRVCEELEGDRDAILAKCVELGVNINTAKTQFYRWRKSQ